MDIATYAAFCRNYGNHTVKAGFHDWNEEAMAVMSRDLSVSWSTFYLVVLDQLNQILAAISSSLDWAANHLGWSRIPILFFKLRPNEHVSRIDATPDGDSDDSLQPLRQALTSRQHVLVDTVEALCDEFQNKLR